MELRLYFSTRSRDNFFEMINAHAVAQERSEIWVGDANATIHHDRAHLRTTNAPRSQVQWRHDQIGGRTDGEASSVFQH